MGWFSRRQERKARKTVSEGLGELEVLLEDSARFEETKAKYLYPQNKLATPQEALVSILLDMDGTP